MGQIKFVEDRLLKIWSDLLCLGPQILLGPFLNTLTYIIMKLK